MKIIAKLSISGAMALGLITTGIAGVLISTSAHAILPGTDSNYSNPNLSNYEMSGGRDPNSVQTGMPDNTNSNLTGNNLNPTVGNPSNPNLGNPANTNLNRNSRMTGEQQNFHNNNGLGTQGNQVRHHHHHHYYHHPKQTSTTQKQQNLNNKNMNPNTTMGPSY